MELANITLKGLVPILFDRFWGHKDGKDKAWQRLHFLEYDDDKGGSNEGTVCVPSEFIMAFLCGQTMKTSCVFRYPLKVGETEKLKLDRARGILASVFIDPDKIPLLHDHKEISVIDDSNISDHKGMRVLMQHTVTFQAGKAIRQPAHPRPMILTPWEINFKINYTPKDLKDALKMWFYFGGLEIGLGNYRPRFGRFESYWNGKEIVPKDFQLQKVA